MKNPLTILIILVLFVIIVLASYSYIFKIYETKIETSTQTLFADNNSRATITAVPVNALGWRAPFRKVKTEFEIYEGRDLVKIISEDSTSGILILQAKDKTGKVIILVKSALALLPTQIEIKIYPNYAMR